jgi:hypothetical protein
MVCSAVAPLLTELKVRVPSQTNWGPEEPTYIGKGDLLSQFYQAELRGY